MLQQQQLEHPIGNNRKIIVTQQQHSKQGDCRKITRFSYRKGISLIATQFKHVQTLPRLLYKDIQIKIDPNTRLRHYSHGCYKAIQIQIDPNTCLLHYIQNQIDPPSDFKIWYKYQFAPLQPRLLYKALRNQIDKPAKLKLIQIPACDITASVAV